MHTGVGRARVTAHIKTRRDDGFEGGGWGEDADDADARMVCVCAAELLNITAAGSDSEGGWLILRRMQGNKKMGKGWGDVTLLAISFVTHG